VPSKRASTSALARMFMTKAAYNSLPDGARSAYCPHDPTRTCTCSSNATSIVTGLPKGSLGKRTTETQTEPIPKKPCHSAVVRNTVLTMMDNWFIEENDILDEDNTRLQEQLHVQHQENRLLQRRIHLLEIQLNAAHRYSRMVEEWVPQVREMFANDLRDMIAVRVQQNADLTAETETEDEE